MKRTEIMGLGLDAQSGIALISVCDKHWLYVVTSQPCFIWWMDHAHVSEPQSTAESGPSGD